MLRILTFSDGHYSVNGDTLVPYKERWNAMVTHINKENEKNPLDFAVFNGDFVYNDPAWLPITKDVLDNGLEVPYYTTIGNHDGVLQEDWEDYWDNPTNHHFESKGVGIVLIGSGRDRTNAGWGIGYQIPDLDYLQSACDFYLSQGKKVIVFCHIQFDHPNFGGQRDGVFGGDGKPLHDYVSSEPGILAVFHGHAHWKNDFEIYDGQLYCWDGHFSQENQMSVEVTKFGYRIIEIDDNHFKTYQYRFPQLVNDSSPINEVDNQYTIKFGNSKMIYKKMPWL